MKIFSLKGKTAVFIDYANIKAWAREKGMAFDMEVLFQTLKNSGAERIFLYYGTDPKNLGSHAFLRKMREIGFEVVTKEVKYFRISLSNLLKQRGNREMLKRLSDNTRKILLKEINELEEKHIRLYAPKANFDVEITLDMTLLENKYANFCLFSGDSDFSTVLKYLKSRGKYIIVLAGKHYMSGEIIRGANQFIFLEKLMKKNKNILIKTNPRKMRGWEKSK